MKLLLAVASALVGASILVTSADAAKTTFTMGMILEPPNLDPTGNAAAAIDEVVYANVFEGLTRIDRNGEVKPALAESWTIADDNVSYSFTLRSGVTFHDGTSFECDDVKFSFERAGAEDSTNAQKRLFAPIASIDCPDPQTVNIKLKAPTGSFLFDMGWGDAVIVAPESADNNKTDPIGTGPFKFKRWVKGDRVELERNDAYWGEPVALTAATFKFISDPSAATAALMAGDVDAYANFPAPEVLAQFEADPRFTVHSGTTEGETILALNNAKPPFDNVDVRRAIAHAIDKKAIVDGAMFGQGTPIGSHVAPHNPAYVDLTGQYPHDPAKAIELLTKAGHGDGLSVVLRLPPPSYARRGGEIVAAQLAQIGIKAEIVPVEWAQWLDQVFKRTDYDMTIVSHTEPADIGIYARDKYYFNYQSAEFKEMYMRYTETVDPEAAKALLGDLQKKLADDSVNVFLFQLAKTGIWNSKVEGLWENSPVQANDLTEVRWKE